LKQRSSPHKRRLLQLRSVRLYQENVGHRVELARCANLFALDTLARQNAFLLDRRNRGGQLAALKPAPADNVG
jgi:hypothetical protein